MLLLLLLLLVLLLVLLLLELVLVLFLELLSVLPVVAVVVLQMFAMLRAHAATGMPSASPAGSISIITAGLTALRALLMVLNRLTMLFFVLLLVFL